jgi:hypothetical protein
MLNAIVNKITITVFTTDLIDKYILKKIHMWIRLIVAVKCRIVFRGTRKFIVKNHYQDISPLLQSTYLATNSKKMKRHLLVDIFH